MITSALLKRGFSSAFLGSLSLAIIATGCSTKPTGSSKPAPVVAPSPETIVTPEAVVETPEVANEEQPAVVEVVARDFTKMSPDEVEQLVAKLASGEEKLNAKEASVLRQVVTQNLTDITELKTYLNTEDARNFNHIVSGSGFGVTTLALGVLAYEWRVLANLKAEHAKGVAMVTKELGALPALAQSNLAEQSFIKQRQAFFKAEGVKLATREKALQESLAKLGADKAKALEQMSSVIRGHAMYEAATKMADQQIEARYQAHLLKNKIPADLSYRATLILENRNRLIASHVATIMEANIGRVTAVNPRGLRLSAGLMAKLKETAIVKAELLRNARELEALKTKAAELAKAKFLSENAAKVAQIEAEIASVSKSITVATNAYNSYTPVLAEVEKAGAALRAEISAKTPANMFKSAAKVESTSAKFAKQKKWLGLVAFAGVVATIYGLDGNVDLEDVKPSEAAFEKFLKDDSADLTSLETKWLAISEIVAQSEVAHPVPQVEVVSDEAFNDVILESFEQPISWMGDENVSTPAEQPLQTLDDLVAVPGI